jgi:hypothetical protein
LLHIPNIDLECLFGVVSKEVQVKDRLFYAQFSHVSDRHGTFIINIKEAHLIYKFRWLDKIKYDHTTVNIIVWAPRARFLNDQHVPKRITVLAFSTWHTTYARTWT